MEEGEEERQGEEKGASWPSCLFYFLTPGAGWQGLFPACGRREARTWAQGGDALGPFPSLHSSVTLSLSAMRQIPGGSLGSSVLPVSCTGWG